MNIGNYLSNSPLVDQNLTTEVIRTLPTQSKLVLLSCVVDGLTGLLGHVSHTGDVYSIYKELSKMIGIETLTQRRMTDLLTELNTMSIITLKMVFKGRYGNTKEVRLTAPGQVYYNVIMEDTRIKDYEESIKGLTRASKLYTNPL